MPDPRVGLKTAVVVSAVPFFTMLGLAVLGSSCQSETAAQACPCLDSGAIEPTCCETPSEAGGAEDARDAAHDHASDGGGE
jgi:hypothetical protein